MRCPDCGGHRRNPVPPNYSFNVDFTTDPYFPPDLLHDAALSFGRAVRVQNSKRGTPPARAYAIGIRFLEAANYVNAYLDSLYNLNEQKEEWVAEADEAPGDEWPLSSRDERYMQSRRQHIRRLVTNLNRLARQEEYDLYEDLPVLEDILSEFKAHLSIPYFNRITERALQRITLPKETDPGARRFRALDLD